MVHKATYDVKHGKGIKMLTPKQMLQRLPIFLAQVKAGNTSKKLLNEIRQIIYSYIQDKGITKQSYSNTMNSIRYNTKIDTIFTNFKNSKTSNPRRLLLHLTDKINLERSDKYVALSNFSICYAWQNIKKSHKNNKFKISVPT